MVSDVTVRRAAYSESPDSFGLHVTLSQCSRCGRARWRRFAEKHPARPVQLGERSDEAPKRKNVRLPGASMIARTARRPRRSRWNPAGQRMVVDSGN